MTSNVLRLCIVGLLVNTSKCKLNMGNFFKIATVTSIKLCPEDTGLWKPYVYISKFNRTMAVINGNATLDRQIDDTFKVKIQISRWGDGGWKQNFINVERNKACSFAFLVVGEFVKQVLENVNVEPKCPVPKGFYETQNLQATWPIPNLIRNSGTYQGKVIIIDNKNDESVLCVLVTANAK